MVVVFVVVGALGAGPGFVVSFVDASLAERERWNAGVCEGEVVGAIVASRGIRAGRGDRVAELFGDGFDGGEEGGALRSASVELIALAEGKDLVEVEVEVELADGNGRMLCEIRRAEQALLFGCDGGEDDRVRRLDFAEVKARAISMIIEVPVPLSPAPLKMLSSPGLASVLMPR